MTTKYLSLRVRSLALLALIAAFIVPVPVSAATSPWQLTGKLNTARYYQSATLLPDGRVLVAGGTNGKSGALASAELYNPVMHAWSVTANMQNPRSAHTATLLANGQVLVAGGYDISGNPVATAELYDPQTGSWKLTGSMAEGRSTQAAMLLANGKVLVAGGWAAPGTSYGLASAELYDPVAGTWTTTGSMQIGRAGIPIGVTLMSGKVLVAGGGTCCPYSVTGRQTAELYDPTSGTWSSTGSMVISRWEAAGILLTNGQVLVAGGSTGSDLHPTTESELYDPGTGTWAVTGNMVYARTFGAAGLLTDGRVLVAGGASTVSGLAAITNTSEAYDPASQTWSPTGTMHVARWVSSTAVLSDGHVLVAGGQGSNDQATAVSELFTPPPELTLSPSTGMRGTLVAVSGVAFRSSTQVFLTFNGIQLPRTCSTDATGSIANCSFFVPVLPAGHYPVSASDGIDYAQTTFTITP